MSLKNFFKLSVISFLTSLFLFFPGSEVKAQTYGGGEYGSDTYGGNTSSGNSISQAGPPVCNDQAPGSAPYLYSATAVNGTTVKLYFTEATNPVDKYVVEFGLTSGHYLYSALNAGGRGTIQYTANMLIPNTRYYFRLRASNGCATGAWSNEISVKTQSLVSFNSLDLYTKSSNPTPQIQVKNQAPKEFIPAKPNTEDANPVITPVIPQDSYNLTVKVIDSESNPVAGAKLVLRSDPQYATTDLEGQATFAGIKGGEHSLTISYNKYEGTQTVFLGGNEKEISIKVEIVPKGVFLNKTALIIIGFLVFIIVCLVVALVRKNKSASATPGL